MFRAMADVQERIKQLVTDNRVVLFMKGTRMFPQCGFSARAVEIFKRCDVPVKDVNVLADPEIRDGIKAYSNWPTIPQAYIDGEFVGGSDILLEMYENGELHKKLGVGAEEAAGDAPPKITVTQNARAQFVAAAKDVGEDVLRFDVSRSFAYDLFFGRKVDGDWAIDVGDGLTLHVSKQVGARADGVTIDFVDGPQGAGFKIDNPNEPASVKPVSPEQLKAWLAEGDVYLFDCRGDNERALATIEGAKSLSPDTLAGVPRDARIVVHCHHGVRSKSAAEQLLQDGFSNVHSLVGGIDAWSATVDGTVPRY